MTAARRPSPVEATELTRYPAVDGHGQTNVPGLFIIGDLTGLPLVKTAANQGYDLVEYLVDGEYQPLGDPGDDGFELILVGAGPAGLNAALEAQRRGLRYILLEKQQIAATFHTFPPGKWIYTAPDSVASRGELWVEEGETEQFLDHWQRLVAERGLRVETGVEVVTAQRPRVGQPFEVRSADGRVWRAPTVALAIGRQGSPRGLEVPGAELPKVNYRLSAPEHHQQERILVVGGGDSAAEAALALADRNEVTISYRRERFSRLLPANRERLSAAVDSGRVQVLYRSEVQRIEPESVTLAVAGEGERTLPNDQVYALLGNDLPVRFLRRLGIQFAGEWTYRRVLAAIAVFTGLFLFYFGKELYGDQWVRAGHDVHYWYTVLYTILVDGFGLYYIRKYDDPYIRRRNWMLMVSHTVFVFLLPFVLVQHEGWKYFGLIYAFPLFMAGLIYTGGADVLQVSLHHTFHVALPAGFYTYVSTDVKWLVYGLILTFVIIPIGTYYFGKRFYCGWVCQCGGLAETFGEPWRELSPKGDRARRWQVLINIIMVWAFLTGALVVAKAMIYGNGNAAQWSVRNGFTWLVNNNFRAYHLLAETMFSSWIGIATYPFFGGRMWCRYGCPLAAWMNVLGRWSRFRIRAVPGKCIACGQCNRFCEMGIDIQSQALAGEAFGATSETPCVGCGVCLYVCPVDVLYIGDEVPEFIRRRTHGLAAEPSSTGTGAADGR